MAIEANTEEFSRKMRSYAAIYGPRHDKGLSVIILERAGKLAFELYKQTKAIAPNQSKIAGDVQKLGWRIPARFPDGRLGRGDPDQWLGTAVKELPKVRGRKTNERRALEASIRNSKPTLQQMQHFVIQYRARHAGYIATGWLRAIHELGVYGVTSAKGQSIHGRIEVKVGEVEIINDVPGAAIANQKYGFVQKAIDAQTADMTDYIVDHLQQARKAA